MLRVSHLRCQFHETPLFTGLNFSLSPQECLQIVGGNGSGKTSLLRILSGLRWPDEGEVVWKNKPISKIKMQYARERFYLGHKVGFKMELTVKENLELYQSLYQFTLSFDEITLLSQLHQPIQTLSIGQQKRLGLILLSSLQTPLWILDEPFSGLDVAGIEWLTKKITSHCENQGMVIFTSHQTVALATKKMELSSCCFSN